MLTFNLSFFGRPELCTGPSGLGFHSPPSLNSQRQQQRIQQQTTEQERPERERQGAQQELEQEFEHERLAAVEQERSEQTQSGPLEQENRERTIPDQLEDQQRREDQQRLDEEELHQREDSGAEDMPGIENNHGLIVDLTKLVRNNQGKEYTNPYDDNATLYDNEAGVHKSPDQGGQSNEAPKENKPAAVGTSKICIRYKIYENGIWRDARSIEVDPSDQSEMISVGRRYLREKLLLYDQQGLLLASETCLGVVHADGTNTIWLLPEGSAFNIYGGSLMPMDHF